MLRTYISEWDGGETLPRPDPGETHHLLRVRRARAEEPVEVMNGRGAVARARVLPEGSAEARLVLMDRWTVEPSPLSLHLLVALPKGKSFSMLLQKAVELGVTEVTPLVTDHVEMSAGRVAGKQDRWEAVLMEAVKQSGNPWKPALHKPVGLKTFLRTNAGPAQRLCAALQKDARPLWHLLGDPLKREGKLELFVGPEGDFSLREYADLRESGCHFASLGPLVLKVETAASLLLGTLRLWADGR
ncbi:MAG: RsmE family RNA methyltransferase [Oceanipulchritudo sp.]